MLISGALKNKKAVLSQISGSNEPLRRYGHSKLSKMAACRQLGFDVTRLPEIVPQACVCCCFVLNGYITKTLFLADSKLFSCKYQSVGTSYIQNSKT